MWGTRPKRALLVATLSAVALLAAGTSVSAAEPGSITIKKVCPPGFGGLAQIEVSKVLGVGVETGAAGFNIECGSSLRVSSIPGDSCPPSRSGSLEAATASVAQHWITQVRVNETC
jgi:hypothetical protein